MRLPDFPSVDDGRIAIQIKGPDIARFRYITGLPGSASGAFSIAFELGDTPSGREILELDLTTSLGHVTAKGVLGDAPGYIGSTLDFQLTSASLARLGSAYGIERLPDNPITVTGNVALEAGGIRSAGPLTFIVDEVSASVEGLVVRFTDVSGTLGNPFSITATKEDLPAGLTKNPQRRLDTPPYRLLCVRVFQRVGSRLP